MSFSAYIFYSSFFLFDSVLMESKFAGGSFQEEVGFDIFDVGSKYVGSAGSAFLPVRDP